MINNLWINNHQLNKTKQDKTKKKQQKTKLLLLLLLSLLLLLLLLHFIEWSMTDILSLLRNIYEKYIYIYIYTYI